MYRGRAMLAKKGSAHGEALCIKLQFVFSLVRLKNAQQGTELNRAAAVPLAVRAV